MLLFFKNFAFYGVAIGSAVVFQLFSWSMSFARRLMPEAMYGIFEHCVTSPIVRTQVHVVTGAVTAYVFYVSSEWDESFSRLCAIANDLSIFICKSS